MIDRGFTAKGPIGFGGGFNFYVYVLNNPVNLIDVDGQMAQAAAIYFVPGVGEAALVVTGAAVIGYGIYKGTGALLDWVFNEQADESNSDSSSGEGKSCPPKRGRSWTG